MNANKGGVERRKSRPGAGVGFVTGLGFLFSLAGFIFWLTPFESTKPLLEGFGPVFGIILAVMTVITGLSTAFVFKSQRQFDRRLR